MQFHKGVDQVRPPSDGEPRYEPPQIEMVVTTGELERESLYAGEAGYATF